jgi:GNAT superfamily N-acetyltransferase
MTSVTFKIIEHGSHEYKKAVCLREDILRKPLGLAFTREELDRESAHIHIVGFLDKDLCATVVLVPQKDVLKMQRVAVREDLQSKGIASAMMKFCEDYAINNGFKEIYCHARQTAAAFYLKNKYVSDGEPFIEIKMLHQKMRKIFSA